RRGAGAGNRGSVVPQPAAGHSAKRGGGMGGVEPRTAQLGRVHHEGIGMNREEFRRIQSRRRFFQECAGGIGIAALAQLMGQEGRGATTKINPLAPKKPHFPPKAKNVIFMFMEGGPSQLDLFDPKPELKKWSGNPLPAEMTKNLRLAFTKPNAA